MLIKLEKLKEIIQDESISIGKIKSTMKQVVPTYKEPEEVNKKKKENITYIVIINYKRGDDDQYE